jgi:hypothetical protein
MLAHANELDIHLEGWSGVFLRSASTPDLQRDIPRDRKEVEPERANGMPNDKQSEKELVEQEAKMWQ